MEYTGKKGNQKGLRGLREERNLGERENVIVTMREGSMGRGKEKWKGKDVKTWFGVSLTTKKFRIKGNRSGNERV